MTGEQLEQAMKEFQRLEKELLPVTNGFGLKGLTITVALKGGEKFELAELDVVKNEAHAAPLKVRGVGRTPSEKDAAGNEKPARWFAVHFDHEQVSWVEFETFPG